MTVWFVSRHPGAIAWAQRHGIGFDRHVPHLEPELVRPGDTVMGSLPVHLAAQVCERGAHLLNLSLDLPADARGRELSADDLERYDARLEAYFVEKCR